LLDQPIRHRRNPQFAHPAIGLRDLDAPAVLHHTPLQTRLHLALPRCAPASQASDALHVRATRTSALRPKLAATTASADLSLHLSTVALSGTSRDSPGENALLRCTTAGFTPLRLDHQSFAVHGPLALLGSALYPMLVHQLAAYTPRLLRTLGRPRPVALHFVRCDQLTAGLAPG